MLVIYLTLHRIETATNGEFILSLYRHASVYFTLCFRSVLVYVHSSSVDGFLDQKACGDINTIMSLLPCIFKDIRFHNQYQWNAKS